MTVWNSKDVGINQPNSQPINHLVQLDDNQLVAIATTGCQQAFEQLYRRHHQRVYAICFRLSGQTALADDMAQACFIRLWHKLGQFNGDSQFTTWLHRLCVRQAINDLKAQQSLWRRFLPAEDIAHQDMPSVELTDYHLLDKCIAKLPQRTRIVFVLCAIEGYQHNEIAALLNIAVGTSKAQYHNAKHLLQEMLT
ncbi:RNA polymerase sigma factor [Shewanella litoralis]|uniref:RNA polymerase subunit sigma-24 n=1 Tax=Shewanella litoralis TaxID=2282700 RepID=A0ABQ2RFV6_9GAMM|nr:RNA polymerase sigma factor [Shewanella litoralis]GGQ24889.1 RNA polymerase subunit sigma-24 [Shewanella litoralis]